MLRKRFQATLMNLLHHKLDKSFFIHLDVTFLKAYKDGFYMYAKPNPSTNSKKVVNYVVRYISRPATTQSCITHYTMANILLIPKEVVDYFNLEKLGNPTVPPHFNCQKCDDKMKPIYYVNHKGFIYKS